MGGDVDDMMMMMMAAVVLVVVVMMGEGERGKPAPTMLPRNKEACLKQLWV